MSETTKKTSGAVLKAVIAASSVVALGMGAVALGLRSKSNHKSVTKPAPSPVASNTPEASPSPDPAFTGGMIPSGRPDLTGQPPRKTVDFGARTGTAVYYDADRKQVLALDVEGGALVTLDPVSLDILSTIQVGKRPALMVVDHSGRAFITLRDEAAIAIVENGQVSKLTVGADPYGIALSPDHLSALVVAGGSNRLVAFDTETLREQYRVPLPPMARAVATDGKIATVAHAAGGNVSVVDLAEAREANRGERNIAGSVRQVALTGVGGRRQGGGFAIVLDRTTNRAIIPHLSMDTGETRPSEQRVFGTYGGGDPEFSQPMQVVASGIDLDQLAIKQVAGKVATTPENASTQVLPAFQMNGSALVRAASIAQLDKGGQLLLLGDDGTHRVMVFTMNGSGFTAAHMLAAPDGARGMAVSPDGQSAYVVASFSRTVSKYDLDKSHGMIARRARTTKRLGEETLDEKLQLGRRLFHDGENKRLSSGGLACATCHPDGLRDNNVWTTDVGNRRTAILAGRLAGTAPYHWRGERPDLQTSMKATITRLGGKGLQKKEAEALEAYLLAMPVPATDAGDLPSDLIDEGQRIFMSAEAGCAGCHMPGMGYRDGKLHDVGTANKSDVGLNGTKAVFDTPSLQGVSAGGPYYHDGSAATLEDLVAGANTAGRHMGDTSHLSPEQRKALVAYLKTL